MRDVIRLEVERLVRRPKELKAEVFAKTAGDYI